MNSIFFHLEVLSAIAVFTMVFSMIIKNKDKTDRLLTLFMSALFLSLLADIGTFVFETSSKYLLYFKICWVATYLFVVLTILFFHLYVVSYLKSNKIKVKHAYSIIIAIGSIISSALWVVSLFIPLCYKIFDDCTYVLNNHYMVCVSIEVLCFLIDALLALSAAKKIGVRKIIGFATYIISPLAALIITELFELDTSLMYVAMSLSCLVALCFINADQSYELREQREELSNAKVKVMLSQIQPHFLYNSLSAIMAIPGNPPETQDAIADFGKYLRGNLDVLNSQATITFDKELNHVEVYIGLEKLRFGDKLNVKYDIQARAFEIPGLTLQMLVENSVKHGITVRDEGGTILIKTYETKFEYVIEVIDDGVGFNYNPNEVNADEHVGLNNVSYRLKKLVNGSLQINGTMGKGTKATVTIPKKREARKK